MALLKFLLYNHYGPVEITGETLVAKNWNDLNDMLFHSDTLRGSNSKHRPVRRTPPQHFEFEGYTLSAVCRPFPFHIHAAPPLDSRAPLSDKDLALFLSHSRRPPLTPC